MSERNNCCNFNCVLAVLILASILLALIILGLAIFGLLAGIVLVLPYIIAFAIFVLAVAIGLLAACGFTERQCESFSHQNSICDCICRFAGYVIAGAIAVIIIAGLGIIGIPLGAIFAFILIFLGAVAFWFMLLSLIALIRCIICKTCNR